MARSGSKQQTVTAIEFDFTPRFSREIWEEKLNQIVKQSGSPMIKSYLRRFEGYLVKLKPSDVQEAIETGTLVEDEVKTHRHRYYLLPFAKRMLKHNRNWRAKLAEVVTEKNMMLILQHKNPKVYQIIEDAGEDGQKWSKENCESFLRLLGIREGTQN